MASIEKIKQLREMTGAGMMDVKKALDASDDNIEAAIDWLRTNGIAKAAKKADRVAAEGVVISVANDKVAAVYEVNSETDYVATNASFVTAVEKVGQAILANGSTSTTAEEANAFAIDGETVESLMTNLTATIGERIYLRRVSVKTLDGETAGAYTHSNKRIAAFITGTGVDADLLRDIAMHAAAMSPEALSIECLDKDFVAKETAFLTDEYQTKMADKSPEMIANIVQGALNKKFAEVALLEQVFVKDGSTKIKDLIGSGTLTTMELFHVGEGIEVEATDFAAEVMAQVNK